MRYWQIFMRVNMPEYRVYVHYAFWILYIFLASKYQLHIMQLAHCCTIFIFLIFSFFSPRAIFVMPRVFFFLVNCGMFAGIYSHCAFVRLFTIAIAIATTHSFGSFNTILTFLTPFCTRCRYKAQYHCIYHKKSLTFVVSNFFTCFCCCCCCQRRDDDDDDDDDDCE
jgi:hypothetical protein